MQNLKTYTATFLQSDDWWMDDFPGANTQGKTLEEARENLKEAISLILESQPEVENRSKPQNQLIHEEITI